jgi:hypothetical protein
MIKMFTLSCFLLFIFTAFGQKPAGNPGKECVIEFVTKANGKKIILNDSIYTNAFDEKYTVSKLKYYISDFHFITGANKESKKFDRSVYLVDAAKENNIRLKIPAGKITGISFLLGVDSINNCSGAQSGALDPLNDMFWTWNSGYVSFKMEGKSDSSKTDLQRIEQHIGGYKGTYKVMRKIFLPVNNISSGIQITADLDKYWDGINKISIAETPMTTTIGINAQHAADNFPGMFSVNN